MPNPPNDALAQALTLAGQHHQAGRLDEAQRIYQRVLAFDPNCTPAVYGMGILAFQANQYMVAAKLIGRAISLNGEWAEACFRLGLALQGSGDFDAAMESHRRALALNAGFFEAQFNLATCLQFSGQCNKAIAAFEAALLLKPEDPRALFQYSIVLRGAGRRDECLAALRKTVAAAPDVAEGWGNLGFILWESESLDEAMQAFRRACDLAPGYAIGHVNLAGALWEAGKIPEALMAQRRVVELLPNDAESHRRLGELLLLSGDWAEGFSQFQWRWKQKNNTSWPQRKFSRPMWDGSELTNRGIYIHAEQSNGDTIQFVRFLPEVLRRGGNVVLECQPALRRLLQGSFTDNGRIHWASPGEAIPEFDVYCPLMSLPYVLGTIPVNVPASAYVRPDADCTAKWQRRLPGENRELKVGIVWAGSPSELQNRRRSLAFSELLPLAELMGVRWVSLQRGGEAQRGKQYNDAIQLLDFTDELSDFADTAGLIAGLDLVISIDTAVAHLAGAMGKEVWTLLPLVPNWRWMMGTEDTPWYSTMRLFRQNRRGEWSDVIQRVRRELRRMIQRRLI